MLISVENSWSRRERKVISFFFFLSLSFPALFSHCSIVSGELLAGFLQLLSLWSLIHKTGLGKRCPDIVNLWTHFCKPWSPLKSSCPCHDSAQVFSPGCPSLFQVSSSPHRLLTECKPCVYLVSVVPSWGGWATGPGARGDTPWEAARQGPPAERWQGHKFRTVSVIGMFGQPRIWHLPEKFHKTTPHIFWLVLHRMSCFCFVLFNSWEDTWTWLSFPDSSLGRVCAADYSGQCGRNRGSVLWSLSIAHTWVHLILPTRCCCAQRAKPRWVFSLQKWKWIEWAQNLKFCLHVTASWKLQVDKSRYSYFSLTCVMDAKIWSA